MDNVTELNKKEEQFADDAEAKVIEDNIQILQGWKDVVIRKLKVISGYNPDGVEAEVVKDKNNKVIGVSKPDYESSLDTQVRNIVAKNKGYIKLIYRFMHDRNQWAPVIIFGFGRINKETDSLVMKIVVGTPDFPLGSVCQFALVDCSIRWMDEPEFIEQSAKMEAFNVEMENKARAEYQKQLEEQVEGKMSENETFGSDNENSVIGSNAGKSKFNIFRKRLDAKDLPITEQDNVV